MLADQSLKSELLQNKLLAQKSFQTIYPTRVVSNDSTNRLHHSKPLQVIENPACSWPLATGHPPAVCQREMRILTSGPLTTSVGRRHKDDVSVINTKHVPREWDTQLWMTCTSVRVSDAYPNTPWADRHANEAVARPVIKCPPSWFYEALGRLFRWHISLGRS